MCKFNPKNEGRRIDPCIKIMGENINWMLHSNGDGWELVASCCGHGIYPLTILARSEHELIFEICSDTYLKRKKRFYKRDKNGYYYIPEVEKLHHNQNTSKNRGN